MIKNIKSTTRIFAIAALALLIALFALKGRALAYFYDTENTKAGGEIEYDGRMGYYYKTARDPLTLSLLRYTYASDNQFLSGKLKFENLAQINNRQVFDFKNYFYGVSHTPQDADFLNISNVYNRTLMQYAISHNHQTVSSLYFDGFLSRFSYGLFNDLAKTDLKLGWVIDHMTSENNYYTFKVEGSENKYPSHPTDDYAYSAASFKLLHKMPKITRTPMFFQKYAFHSKPVNPDPDYIHYTDITYELKAEFGNNRMAYSAPGNYNNVKMDYSINLDFSPVSKINFNGYIDRRAYSPEALGSYCLNFDKHFFNLSYSHDWTPHCTLTPYVNFTKYNYLNAAGFNETETDAGAFLSLKYSDTIYYNLDIKQAYITPFQSMVNYPSQNKFKVFSNWIKYLSEKQRLVLDSELELLDIGLNESIYYASYGMIGSELRYEQKVTDSMYVRTGLGGKLKEYLRYPVNNIRDFYGLIGLTAVF